MFFRFITLLVLVSFALHLVWEFAHHGLYTGYENLTTMPIYLWATIGDVLYTLVAFALASCFKYGIEWIREARWTDFLAMSVLGFFLALYVEYKALALGRWLYAPTMPIGPVFEVGLSPVLQMMLLLPLTLLIVSLVERYISGYNDGI